MEELENDSGATSRIRVRDVILAAFPNDPNNTTKEAFHDLPAFVRSYGFCPSYPPDLFGISALLLERAGAYQYVVVTGEATDHEIAQKRLEQRALWITQAELAEWQALGQMWSEADHVKQPPHEILDIWQALILAGDKRIFTAKGHKGLLEIPDWWRIAYALMVISDTACAGIGFEQNTWVQKSAMLHLLRHMKKSNGADDTNIAEVKAQVSTVGAALNREIACVMPKGRTSSVGCSLRNISLNVALLPPRGALRVHWAPPVANYDTSTLTEMNLMVVPFPYRIQPEAFTFRGRQSFAADVQDLGRPTEWGRFEIDQHWLDGKEEAVVDFVMMLLKKASNRTIHGIVFPEFALNIRVMNMLRERFHQTGGRRAPYFIVAGSSTNCEGIDGNHAMSISRFLTPERDGANVPASQMFSRPKHHRWRLERYQLQEYDIGDERLQDAVWWENLLLEQREMHVAHFAHQSVYSVLICEDLARSEPCHDALRSVGANLIFVLLMDGVQLPFRWSARNATGLSDDPGASVLTLTSRALIERSNRTRKSKNPDHQPSWEVALWTDDNPDTGPVPVSCIPGQHATVIRLQPVDRSEVALDGRVRRGTVAWEIIGEKVDPSEVKGGVNYCFPVCLNKDDIEENVHEARRRQLEDLIREGLEDI